MHLLHIASFLGNIGDNASHTGTYHQLRRALNCDLLIDELEIRKTYQNYNGDDAWHFDSDLIECINDRDCTLIGGGNYFELWLEKSTTGTTINLDPILVEKIRRPLVINGVGFDPYKGYSEKSLRHFQQFLQALIDNPYCLISFRNDGSLGHVRRLLGDGLAKHVHRIPDPGFFVQLENENRLPVLADKPYWAINLAADMPELRFANNDHQHFGYDEFMEEVRLFIANVLAERTDLSIVLIPHIYSDLVPITDLLSALADTYRRSRIVVAPYLQGPTGANFLFNIYRQAELSIGTRFHANVCSIGLGTPSLGLTTYPKLADTYCELGLEERYVDATRPGFAEKLHALAVESVADRNGIVQNYQRIALELNSEAETFYSKVKDLL